MKVLLLGATGRTGKYVLEIALAKGYSVNCLVRNPEKITERDGLKIFKGDTTNANDLEKAILGCNCVISVLNISRSTDFPWSKLRTPDDFLSKTMTKLVSIASKKKVKRIILCSAWGVFETRKEIPLWFKWLIDYSNIGIAYRDHERQEQLLEQSNLEWSIIRPTGLTNSMKGQKVKESFNNNPNPSLTISRKTLATYLVNCVKNNQMIKKKVVLSKM